MSLATRRLIRTIAQRNRATGSAAHRFACIGKDALAYTSPNSGVLSISSIDHENCGVSFVITSINQDRDGDVIQPRGLNLAMWKRSPVWFWNHQQNPYPIGTGRHPQTGIVNVQVTETQVIATCYFDQEDPEAMKVYGKICRGFISACSIGFVPMVMNRLRDKANRDRMAQPAGYDVEQAELVEISITGVGSNRDAFVVGRSFGSAAAIRTFGARSMSKNRVRHLPNKTKPKMLGNGKPINETETGQEQGATEKPGSSQEVGKSSAADVQHVALSKGQFPDQADATKWADMQGLLSDNVTETDTDWLLHQFPETELVPDSGSYTDLADGVKAFAGQQVTEPASGLTPEAGKDGTGATEGSGPDGGMLEEESEEPLKPSARFAMEAIQSLTDELSLQEHQDLVPMIEDFLEELKGFADANHPDLDLYDKPAGTDADLGPVEPDAGEKKFSPYKHRRSLQTKGLSRRFMKSIGEAADHLDDVADSDMSDQKALRMLKTGCRYHAKSLREMLPGETDSQDANMMDDEPADAGSAKAVVLSLADDLELAQKNQAAYNKSFLAEFGGTKAVLGR